jgi:NAD(P)-dependent dehydrogenase (short-subunit alcohol dehydrogenase family)
MKLNGKVALITGAASGIGHGIAKRYVEAGGRVVIADLNADGAARAAKELGDAKTAIGIAMDVTKEDQVNAGVEQAVKAPPGAARDQGCSIVIAPTIKSLASATKFDETINAATTITTATRPHRFKARFIG